MSKFLTGATISYGSTLPAFNKTADGALFYLTTDYSDPNGSGSNPSGLVIYRTAGLYVFSFQQDGNSAVVGEQVAVGWRQLTNLTNYVDVAGDKMTGTLQVGLGTADGGNTGYTTLNIGSTTNPGYLAFFTPDATRRGYVGWKETSTNRLLLTAETGWNWDFNVTPTVNGNVIWHSNNDGSGSGLDSDLLDGQHGSYYTNLANSTGNLDINTRTSGTLSVSRGGTAITTAVQGGIAYGASASSFGFSAAGSAGQLLQSNAASAPTWVSPGSITVGSASSASSVPWTGITSIFTASQTSSGPTPGSTITSRSSLHYDFGSSASATATPNQFPSNSISGFAAYSSSDLGSYKTGITVVGGGGIYGLQIIANWDFEEGAPNSLQFRVNDDTTNPNAWGATRTIWDQGNLTNLSQLTNGPGYQTAAQVQAAGDARYVFRTGDTMSGMLGTPGLMVGSVSAPGTGGINMTGNLTLLGIDGTGYVSAAGNIISNNGNIQAQNGAIIAVNNYVQAGTPSDSLGWVRVTKSGSGNTGYVEFYAGNDVRSGYIGNGGAGGSTDTANINYVSGTHNFSGNVVVSGQVSATGDVIAYSSDARLKKNVTVIQNAVEKVKLLGGYEYDWDLEKTRKVNFHPTNPHEHGLLAQEVAKVVPDAVAKAPFNEDYLTVKYERLVALLVAAVNEQQAQIDSLQSQLVAMSQKL